MDNIKGYGLLSEEAVTRERRVTTNNLLDVGWGGGVPSQHHLYSNEIYAPSQWYLCTKFKFNLTMAH